MLLFWATTNSVCLFSRTKQVGVMLHWLRKLCLVVSLLNLLFYYYIMMTCCRCCTSCLLIIIFKVKVRKINICTGEYVRVKLGLWVVLVVCAPYCIVSCVEWIMGKFEAVRLVWYLRQRCPESSTVWAWHWQTDWQIQHYCHVTGKHIATCLYWLPSTVAPSESFGLQHINLNLNQEQRFFSWPFFFQLSTNDDKLIARIENCKIMSISLSSPR